MVELIVGSSSVKADVHANESPDQCNNTGPSEKRAKIQSWVSFCNVFPRMNYWEYTKTRQKN